MSKKWILENGSSVLFTNDDNSEGIEMKLINIDAQNGMNESVVFGITIDEARALNFLLGLHHGLLKQSPDEYMQILRLINGLGNFVTSYDWEKNGHKKV